MANEMANLTFQNLANEAEWKYPKTVWQVFCCFGKSKFPKNLPNWQENCQKSVVRNAPKPFVYYADSRSVTYVSHVLPRFVCVRKTEMA